MSKSLLVYSSIKKKFRVHYVVRYPANFWYKIMNKVIVLTELNIQWSEPLIKHEVRMLYN